MRGLRRRIFNGLTLLSLLLCVGACVLWVAGSYGPLTVWSRGDPAPHAAAQRVRVAGDSLSYERHADVRPVKADVVVWTPGYQCGDGWGLVRYQEATRLAQTYDRRPVPGTYGTHAELSFSIARVVFVTLLLPLHWLILLAWRGTAGTQRAAAGLCRACGYDLRATPERCPECGMLQAGRDANEVRLEAG